MTIIEYDINRLVWDLVSHGLKKHTLNYVHSSGGHGEGPYDYPDSFTSCEKYVDIEKVNENGITCKYRLGGFDDSKPCTCGADKHNQMLRDMADELLNLINAKQAVR